MKRIVTFRVGDSRYGLPADVVREVLEPGDVKRTVPAGFDRRVDLMRVRERWLPVVEVPGAPAARGEEGEAGSTDDLLLVLGRGVGVVGIVVQEVGDVVAPERAGSRRRGEGLVQIEGQLVRILDPQALLSRSGRLFEEGESSMEESRAKAEPRRIVAFSVGGEEFGLEVMSVLEVLRTMDVRQVPQAPDFVEGVVDIRDAVVPVIDLRARFSVPQDERSSDARLLVSEGEHGRVGLVVDEVAGVVEFAEDAVDAPPDFFKGLAGRYLKGIARTDERMIILLDIDEILSSQERIDLQRLLESVAAPDESPDEDPAGRAGEAGAKRPAGKRASEKKGRRAKKRSGRRKKSED